MAPETRAILQRTARAKEKEKEKGEEKAKEVQDPKVGTPEGPKGPRDPRDHVVAKATAKERASLKEKAKVRIPKERVKEKEDGTEKGRAKV